jgi:tetratricopeptide (TPR) repeat protein
MAQQVIDLNCPGCGGRVSTGQKECIYCHAPIVISTFNSVFSMPMPQVSKYANAYRKELVNNPDNQDLNTSIAMCYLKLKLYDKAFPAFESAIEDNFDNSETFFYAAVCLLKGKKAFVCPRADIDKILEYLNAAIMIEPRGIYYYFLAYIKHDYFERKYLNITPNYQETLQTATDTGVPDADIEQLFSVLAVEKPCFS